MMNAELVKVSVIMPIYNAEAYLRPAIDSVLDQTLREIEIICIDAGSTDGTYEILEEFSKKVIFFNFELKRQFYIKKQDFTGSLVLRVKPN